MLFLMLNALSCFFALSLFDKLLQRNHRSRNSFTVALWEHSTYPKPSLRPAITTLYVAKTKWTFLAPPLCTPKFKSFSLRVILFNKNTLCTQGVAKLSAWHLFRPKCCHANLIKESVGKRCWKLYYQHLRRSFVGQESRRNISKVPVTISHF